MKCSQCGNEKLIKTVIPMKVSSDGYLYDLFPKDIDAYLCTNCGHYEFFSMKKVKDYENLVSQIEEKRVQLKDLEKELSVYIKNIEKLEQLNSEIIEIENQLKNLDITIRKQQELKTELSVLNTKKEILELYSRIIEIENQLDSGLPIETIKQSALRHEIEELEFELKRKNMPSSISSIYSQIRPLREEIRQMEHHLENGEI